MERYTLELRSEAERFVVERALAMHREIEDLTKAAADESMIDVAEKATIRLGRQWMTESFEQIVNTHIAAAEKKAKPVVARSAKRNADTKGGANGK